MTGNPGEKDHQLTPKPGPFSPIGIGTFRGADGSETEPYTVYRGWTVRIPLNQAVTGHNEEWEVLPPELNGNLPATMDGRVLDWSTVEVLDTADIVTGEIIRMYRLPYRPYGVKPVPRPQPGEDPRKAAIRAACAFFPSVANQFRCFYADETLQAQGMPPLTQQEKADILDAALAGRLPYSSDGPSTAAMDGGVDPRQSGGG